MWGSDGGQTLVGGTGHYLNRSAEFDRGVLGLIREYSPTLQTIDDGARPVCCGPSVRVSFGGHSSIQREHL